MRLITTLIFRFIFVTISLQISPDHLAARGNEQSSLDLSVFEPVGKGCSWRRLSPISKKYIDLAYFSQSCTGARAVINKNQTFGLIRFDRKQFDKEEFTGKKYSRYPKSHFVSTPSDGIDSLWRVNLKSKVIENIGFPAGDMPLTFKIDQSGVIFAYAIIDLSSRWTSDETSNFQKTHKFNYQSQDYEYTFERGQPGVATAYKFENNAKAWELVESKSTNINCEGALGVMALSSYNALPESKENSSVKWIPQSKLDQNQGILRANLNPFRPGNPSRSDGWALLAPVSIPSKYVLANWTIFDETIHTTGLYLLVDHENVKPISETQYSASDATRVAFSEKNALIVTFSLGAHPRLLSLDSGKIIYSSDTQVGVTFWNLSAM